MIDKDKEFWVLVVKLLFKRIKEGKVKFAEDRMATTMRALEAVAFDENGNPIFETITAPARAVANMVFTHEMERLQKEAFEREKNSSVHEYLDNPIEVTDGVLRKCAEEASFSELAFELYKETGGVLSISAHAYLNNEPSEMSLKQNQAICVGLLVRITKFMIAVVQMLSTESERGEVIMALNRCILESAVNLRFLLLKNEARFYDQFVKFSLAPERELYDLIMRQIKERGGKELPIETRMLASIRWTCDSSGIKIEEVDQKFRDWGGGMRSRFEALNQGETYVSLQRIPSHAIHGTWVDLLLHHLEPKEGGFSPKSTWSQVDVRFLDPVCLYIIEAARDYLRSFFGDIPELKPLYNRMDDLQKRILKVDAAYEKWLQNNMSSPGT